MHQWLVTVRARPSDVDLARTMLLDGLLPLLAAAPGCGEPRLAACTHCPGEFTYSADWTSLEALERFERSVAYEALMSTLRRLLEGPPKRELGQILAGRPSGPTGAGRR